MDKMLLGRSDQGFIYIFDAPVRILAVDDDPIMREMAMVQLSHPGGEVVTAQDGREAWEILSADPGFDLVLSDLEMPHMTGFGLCAAIREDPRFARLPVVVLTGRDDMFAIDRAYETGATSFATKPVNWRMLGYQLRYVMRHRRDSEAALAAMRLELESAPRVGEPDAPRGGNNIHGHMTAPDPASQDAPAQPDPVACLRSLLAQPPEAMAGIVAHLAGDPAAVQILQRYADLAGAAGDLGAPIGTAGPAANPALPEALPVASPPGRENPVAAMRAHLRQTQPAPDARMAENTGTGLAAGLRKLGWSR